VNDNYNEFVSLSIVLLTSHVLLTNSCGVNYNMTSSYVSFEILVIITSCKVWTSSRLLYHLCKILFLISNFDFNSYYGSS
jgi:hypothetical protein